MNYGFELMSEIIPLCIVAVLGIDMKKGGEKDFLPSIIIHSKSVNDCSFILSIVFNSPFSSRQDFWQRSPFRFPAC